MMFAKLSEQDQLDIFKQVSAKTGLNLQIIEKDWWVTMVLQALFSLPYADQLSFKGGTSLSKCWRLIERFSEDVDVAINREYLGFEGTLSKTQISDKLRRSSCAFVRDVLQFDLLHQLLTLGLDSRLFSISVNRTQITTTDPEIIRVDYQSLLPEIPYIQHRVLIDVSGRSMTEPISNTSIQSLVDENFLAAPFRNPSFTVRSVDPQRTFMEKICLLHEEFSKPHNQVRVERMSRHLYDLQQISQTKIADKALENKELFYSVIEHRRLFIGLKGFDYDTLYSNDLQIVPPPPIKDLWRDDYRTMQTTMIYGESPSFDDLLVSMQQLSQKARETLQK